MKMLFLLLFALLVPEVSHAQSSPNWPLGYVPSPTEWKASQTSKADVTNGTLTNPTITGGSSTGTATGMSVTSTGGQTAPLSQWTASANVVVPTGVLATDTATLTAAFATSATNPVVMSPGTYNVCTPLTVPGYGVVKASQGNDWQFYETGVFSWAQLPTTRIQCNGTNGFTSGQAFITAKDFSWIEGVAILGFAWPTLGASAGVNCFNVSNSFYVTLNEDYGIRCKEGILANSQGSADPIHNHVEGLRVTGGLYFGNDDHGIYSHVTNGGFLSDSYFGNKANFAGNESAGLFFDYVGATQFNDMRVEDNFNLGAIGGLTPAVGLDIEGSPGAVTIVGNIFDRNAAASIRIGGVDGGSSGITIVGNTSEFPFWKAGVTGTAYHIEFAGNIYGLSMAGNTYGLGNGQTGDNTFTDFIYKCTSCGFTSNAEIAENPPVMLTGVYYDDATRSAMAQYTPVLAPNNYITGGAGLTSGYFTADGTLTPAAVANPFGTTPLAASFVEDSTASVQHYFQINNQTAVANSTYTISGYIKVKSGSRNFGITATDTGGFGNYAQLVLNPTTGIFAVKATVGSAKVFDYAAMNVGNGWYYFFMTYTLGTAASFPDYQFSNYSGTNNNYTGDGASGFYVWNFQVTQGLASTAPSTNNYARSTSSPSNPTGTTSTTGLMMGLAGTITPNITGNAAITVNGTIFNATAIADGAKVQIRWGTSTAPANAAALTGTTCGTLVQYVAATTAEKAPFSETCYVTGLTPGTAYWIDVGLAAITGGTATISDVNIVAAEQ